MDAEATAGYREACAQCSAVDWGVSDEGRFYCRTCHNVTERSQEVEEASFTPGSGRLSTVGRGRRRRTERGRAWLICEGFQVILRVQAEALLTLGVRQDFKDQVLCEMWRLYLQKSGEAYTHRPTRSSTFRLDSESSRPPDSEEDLECSSIASAGSSVEDISYLCGGRSQRGRGQPALSMRTTLALLHLALVWSREALTLSDLLRLVDEGHVPYMHAHEHLPDEMKVEGKAAIIFRVESVPSHCAVHREAESLLSVLQLPGFPPISSQILLHPARLSLRYLLDANLPAQLHPLLCRLMERSGMMDPHLHTCGSAPPALPLYDAQAAAHILVTMKLLYGLDDRTEWDLCSQMSDLHQPGEQQTGEQQTGEQQTGEQQTGEPFSLRRWFRLLHQVLIRAENRKKVHVSRKQWKDTSKPLSLNRKNRCVLMKKKTVAQQLRSCLQKLSPQPAAQQLHPSIFRFSWGDQGGADGPSFHQKKLPGVLTHSLRRCCYWHPALRHCRPRSCGGHYQQVEDTLPHSFRWFLRLFSFLLDIRAPRLYEEVLKVERRLFSRHTPTWTAPC